MYNNKYSRQDLTEQDVIRRIIAVKRDRSFPKRWKDIELEYLNGLLAYVKEQQ